MKIQKALDKLRIAYEELQSAIAETELPMQVEKNVPTSPIALRIAALFNRRPTTPWNVSEIKAFRTGAFDGDDLSLIETYYAAERAKGDKGIHRRDLGTFLNNYSGELDRARAFSQTTPKGWAQDSKLKAREL